MAETRQEEHIISMSAPVSPDDPQPTLVIPPQKEVMTTEGDQTILIPADQPTKNRLQMSPK